MFFARVATQLIDQAVKGDRSDSEGLGFFTYYMVYSFMQMIFGFLAAPILMSFSRSREYRADAGGARLAGRDYMVGSLEALQRNYQQLQNQKPNRELASIQALCISAKSSWSEMFSSHPTLEKRIAKLQKAKMAKS